MIVIMQCCLKNFFFVFFEKHRINSAMQLQVNSAHYLFISHKLELISDSSLYHATATAYDDPGESFLHRLSCTEQGA